MTAGGGEAAKRRKHGAAYYVRHVLAQVWHHPSNRDRRLRAVARACAWQLDKRLRRRPRDLPVFGGLRVRCHPTSTSASNLIYFNAWPDPEEMGFVHAYLRPGDGFIDGGANIGTYTLLAASRVGATGRIDAFEPTASSFARLEENIALNALGQVHLHRAALGEEAGTAQLLTGWDVSNRLFAPGETLRDAVEVPVVTLDGALAEIPYALAKLDLEGAEMFALRGARRRLGRADPPAWLVELGPHLLRRQGSTVAEVESFFQRHGYRFWRFDPTARELFPCRPDRDRTDNALAIHDGALRQVRQRLCQAPPPPR